MPDSVRTVSISAPRARRGGLPVFVLASIGCLSAALLLTLYHLFVFVRSDARLPIGVMVAGVPVGGLTREQAVAQLEAAYLAPVTLRYGDDVFQLDPTQVEFQLAIDPMFASLAPESGRGAFWDGFWDYLWDRQPTHSTFIPLQASYSERLLRDYLLDVSRRYDQPAQSPWADPVYLVTLTGSPGFVLNVDESLGAVSAALFELQSREAALVATEQTAPAATIELLEDQLHTFLDRQNFTGLFSLYLVDLRSGDRLHVNWLNGQDIGTDPDVAFSGMSIMKIVILTEFYRQITDGALPYELDLVELSITESSNWTSNLLIEWIGDLDAGNGLYRLNQTIAALGMESSFIGGLYDTEEPPGFRFTPANTRTDISTNPDPYMQTTASDMGRLLEGIYRCATNGSGLLIDTFGGQFTSDECQDMIDWRSSNRIGVLTEAGVPEGTVVAHKHGWAEGEPIGDASLVLTPGADYVLVHYLWYADYTFWDENSRLMADISRAIYGFFNPISP